MKKVLTILAATMLIASSGFAQMARLQRAGESHAQLSASNPKFVNGLFHKASMNSATKDLTSPIWQDTMSYCLDEEFYTGVGTQTVGDTVYWGIMIEAASLVGRNNLTDVQFYVANGGQGTYTLAIYSGVTPTGTALFSQTLNVAASDTLTWKTVHFTTPVAITQGQPLWVVLQNSDVAYPAAAVAPNSYDNGKWVSLDGVQWMSVADAGVDATWMIRAISDTYTELPPYVELDGPQTVLLGSPAVFTATSPNTNNWSWTVNGTDANNSTNVLTYTFTTAGNNTVIVAAGNNAGTSYDTLNVNVIDCGDAISTFPYSENFEEENPCWLFVSADPANDDRIGVIPFEGEARQGTSVFAFSSYARANDYNQFLISPELDLGSDAMMIKFWYLGYRSNEWFRVLASSTTNDTAAFTTVLGNVTATSTQWTEVAYTLPAGTKYVAINYYANYQYYLYIDSLTIESLTAPEVTVYGLDNIKVGNPTQYTAATLLADTLAWYVDNTEVTGNGNSLSYTFTTAGTHAVVAKATNTVGFSTDTLYVEAFVCDTNTIPYAPSFDNGFGCWDTMSVRTHGAGWYSCAEEGIDFGQVFSMSAQNSFFGLMDLDIDNWLISPYIASATGDYEIAWQASTFDGTHPYDHYSVYIIAGTDTTQLFSETLAEADTLFGWRTVSLPASLNGNFRIAFRHHDTEGGYVLLLDSIQVRALTAPHVTLEGPATAEVGSQVTFTAVSGTATSYAWTIDGSAVNATGNTLTHTFDAVGTHTVAVTATNAAGNSQASATITTYTCDPVAAPWIEGFEGNTQCWNFITVDETSYGFYVSDNPQYAHAGSHNLFGTYSDYSDVDQWAISPVITMPADATNYKLSFYVYTTEYQGIQSNYEVRLSTGGNTIADFTTTLHSENSADANGYAQRVVDMSQYAGQSIRIAFHNITAMGGDAILFDDIELSNTVGIENVENSILRLYPNPASQMVSVNAEGIEGKVTVQIVDLNGRVMMEQQGSAQNYRFDVSTLSQGAYFVRMTSESVNAVSKLIVK